MIPSQADMLFPVHAVGPPGPLPAGARPVSVETPDGNTLHGIHIRPARANKHRLLVLGFGGNAWNGSDVAGFLHHLYPGADVIVFHYRGYRPSTGSPSAKALLADAPLVLEFARKHVERELTVAVGFSIGSGMAASLARDGSVDGAILVTPFDSLKAAAADMLPWLPVSFFFQHEIDSGDFFSRTDVPVAIIAAERDTLIRPSRTEGLREKARNLVFDETIAGASHNDIYERREFAAAMRAALVQVTAKQSKDKS
jgi:pimeloyl-ACP methyl ester carboxylesterase